MASGLPDYYRGIRQRFGAAKSVSGVVTMWGHTTRSILAVEAKGVLYGGVLYIEATETQEDGVPILKVDGQEITDVSFKEMADWNLSREACYPFYLLAYDQIKWLYSVAVMKGITFETGFEVLYEETQGHLPDVRCTVIYAVI